MVIRKITLNIHMFEQDGTGLQSRTEHEIEHPAHQTC